LAIAGLITSQQILEDANMFNLFFNLFCGCILDVVLVGAMKAAIRRQRPPYAKKKYKTAIKIDSWSMPSGHSSRSVFVAFFALFTLGRPAVGFLALVWSACTALSRVAMGRHYISDVLVGAVVAGINLWVVQNMLQ